MARRRKKCKPCNCKRRCKCVVKRRYHKHKK